MRRNNDDLIEVASAIVSDEHGHVFMEILCSDRVVECVENRLITDAVAVSAVGDERPIHEIQGGSSVHRSASYLAVGPLSQFGITPVTPRSSGLSRLAGYCDSRRLHGGIWRSGRTCGGSRGSISHRWRSLRRAPPTRRVSAVVVR